MFEVILYFFVYAANNDSQVESVGAGSLVDNGLNASTTSDLSITHVSSWTDGFNVKVFGMPWWADALYKIFIAVLPIIGGYALIRGLN